MASASFQSSHVELWGQPEITRPEPLRIVKERANTIAGCGTSREVPVPRRRSAGQPNTRGSSPEGPSRILAIYKRRRARGSVLDGSLEWNFRENPTSSDLNQAAELHNSPHENDNASPRAHQSSARIVTVGSFLKSELFRVSSETELNIRSPQTVKAYQRDRNDTFNPLDMELFPSFRLSDLGSSQKISSKTCQRRQSIGKKLVSKAFDGLGNARSKSMHFLRSKSSKDSSIRQVSVRNLDSSRQIFSEASSRNSSRFSFEQESVLTRDSGSSLVISADALLLSPTPSFILYPEITVIPEVDSVDASDEASIWVAVVVTGVLQKTADCGGMPDTLLASKNSSMSQDEMTPKSTDYGYLHGVDITLAARKGCVLESVIAEQNQPRRLHLGQTELTVAKVKLLVGRRSSSHIHESSKDLIAELESRLGNATTEYLSVGISYKHSAFPTSRSSTAAINGLSYHTTTTRIEAHAVIKRHCAESSWSHQKKSNPNSSRVPNPLILLINAHYDPVKAARLICKIATDPVSLAEVNWRQLNTDCRWNSSSDTITAIRRKSSRDMLHQTAQLENFASIPESKQSTQAGFHDTDSNPGILPLNPCSDLDPARKIWSDMRKTSRATGKRCSYTTESSEIGMDGGSNGSSDVDVSVQKEQTRILELALRNKRSLGADTLRSMASPSRSIGLGMGQGWGWGPPWW